jgi:hypothetical protein
MRFGTSWARWAVASALLLLAAMPGLAAPSVRAQTGDTAAIDLTGAWTDGAYPITIAQSGADVTAVYTETQVCDFRDDSGGSQPYPGNVDFVGTFVDGELTGTIDVCHWGTGNPLGIGVFEEPIQLSVSADGNTLSGTWQGQNGAEAMSVTRGLKRDPVCGDLENRLASGKQDVGRLGAQLDQQLQTAFGELTVAVTQAGLSDGTRNMPPDQAHVARGQLVAVVGDILTLRTALQDAHADAFFADPRWTTMLELDSTNVQAAAQLTQGSLIAVPTPIMVDLTQTMASAAVYSNSNQSIASQLAAQGCPASVP